MKRSGLLLLLLLAACASSPPEQIGPRPGPTPVEGPANEETEQLEALRGRATQLDEELSDALADPKPRCERQCGLVEQICELSEKICGIAQRHADDADHDYAQTCRDGRGRCAQARQRVAACTCPPQQMP